MGFEEAFYEKKNLDPKMRALLNSLAKTDHTLANKIEAPLAIKKKSCSIYEYEQDFSIYNDIFYNISFDYPENFSL
jgi:hypothetical protein